MRTSIPTALPDIPYGCVIRARHVRRRRRVRPGARSPVSNPAAGDRGNIGASNRVTTHRRAIARQMPARSSSRSSFCGGAALGLCSGDDAKRALMRVAQCRQRVSARRCTARPSNSAAHFGLQVFACGRLPFAHTSASPQMTQRICGRQSSLHHLPVLPMIGA